MSNSNFVKFARTAMILLAFSGSAFACELSPRAVHKIGSCPSGYSSSGNYCTPRTDARFAVEKIGSCPSGYSSSGNYCLSRENGKHAFEKVGSCPSGYSSSGNYCVSRR